LVRAREAWLMIERAVSPLKTVKVQLSEALGLVLGCTVKSRVSVPPFDRAAMDGYAVRAEDVEGASFDSPRILRIVGSVEIGGDASITIGRGEAVRIDNGAPLPRGANAVVPLEYASERGLYLEVYRSVAKWENVSRKGEDVSEGEGVLIDGKPLEPWDLALLRALGVEEVEVRMPRVAVISTGSELVEKPSEASGKSIVDTNRPMLVSALRRLGCRVTLTRLVREESEESVRKVLRESVEEADLVVVTGGCSVGRKDYVAKSMKSMGDLLFHGVAIRPGMPTAAAIIEDRLVIGLPGSPVAAYVSYKLFVEQAVYRLEHRREACPPPLEAPLEVKVDSTPGFMDLVRAKVVGGKVRPVRRRGSTLLSSISRSDGVVAVPEDYEGLKAGTYVHLYLHGQPWEGILRGEVP